MKRNKYNNIYNKYYRTYQKVQTNANMYKKQIVSPPRSRRATSPTPDRPEGWAQYFFVHICIFLYFFIYFLVFFICFI